MHGHLCYSTYKGLYLGGGGGGHSPPPPEQSFAPLRLTVVDDMVQLATAEYKTNDFQKELVCLCRLGKQCDSGVYSRQLALQNMMFSFGAASM